MANIPRTRFTMGRSAVIRPVGGAPLGGSATSGTIPSWRAAPTGAAVAPKWQSGKSSCARPDACRTEEDLC